MTAGVNRATHAVESAFDDTALPRPGRRKAPHQGGLTTGRLTGRDEGRPVLPPLLRRAGRAAASAFTSYRHAVPWALGSNGPRSCENRSGGA
jgi:hypothetical protein